MPIDFSSLDAISAFSPPTEANIKPTGGGNEKDNTAEPVKEKAAQKPFKSATDKAGGRTEVKAKQQREATAAAEEVYQRWQRATVRTEEQRAEILKGLKTGADTEKLLALACRCIGSLANNSLFSLQVEEALEEHRKRHDLILELADTVLVLEDLPFISPTENQIKAGKYYGTISVQLALLLKGTEEDRGSILMDKKELTDLCRNLKKWAEPEPAKTEPVKKTRTSSKRMKEFIYWREEFRKIGVEAGVEDPDPTVESLTGPLHVTAKTIDRYCQDSGRYYIDGDRVRKKK